jgi:hypothetical protein
MARVFICQWNQILCGIIHLLPVSDYDVQAQSGVSTIITNKYIILS